MIQGPGGFVLLWCHRRFAVFFCLVALFCLSGKFRWGQFKLRRFAASGVFVVLRVWGLVHRDEAAVCLQVNQGAAQRRAAQVRSQSKDTFQQWCRESFCLFCCCCFISCYFINVCVYFIYLFSHSFVFCRSAEDSEGNRDICSEILQMKALERLTSTVSRQPFFCFVFLIKILL